ncbi:septum formation initiator family protein [Rapidithrix thailandica]|uniref:Septum formation initiator family protein n=1 Tax=Rapidithrix thailandica TaxID=413964 RepID=A0AAW9S6M7_9BACT
MKSQSSNILLRIIKNFYFLIGVSFLVWMIFFDSNSLTNQRKLDKSIEELESEKAFYQQGIEEMHKNLKELNSDPSELEKFAREKYLFKKKGEKIYLLESE